MIAKATEPMFQGKKHHFDFPAIRVESDDLSWAQLEKLSALVPPPRVHQVRYGGCLAPHSKLRAAITPTPRQQGVDQKARAVSAGWGWAQLLKRVFALDLTRCPTCQTGTLRLIAPITSRPVIRRILCHLKLDADPPPIAEARLSQGRFAWSSP